MRILPPPIPTDADDIRASSTCPQRFSAVFDRHHRAIWLFGYRRSDRETADDIASRTFVRAFEIRDRYDLTQANARPWLYAIARGLLLHHFRDSARHQEKDRVAALLEPTSHVFADPGQRLDAERARPDLVAALNACRPEDVELLLLTTLEACTYEEAAVITGVPIGTVRSRLSRLKSKLSELLRPHWEMCQ